VLERIYYFADGVCQQRITDLPVAGVRIRISLPLHPRLMSYFWAPRTTV